MQLEMRASASVGLRERKRLGTREAIYRAAVELIVEQGYEATTMDAIAARADSARRTVFNHFPSKGEITHEWADRRRNRAAHAAQAAVGSDGTMADRLKAWFNELVVVTESAPRETREMLLGWLSARGPVYNRSWLTGELDTWMSDGQDEGVFRRDVCATTAADVIYDVYLGVLFRWIHVDQPQPGRLKSDLDDAVAIVLGGLHT